MLKDSFRFSLYINLNACFVDYGLLNHGTFLTEDEQAFNATLKLSSCRGYLTRIFLCHQKQVQIYEKNGWRESTEKISNLPRVQEYVFYTFLKMHLFLMRITRIPVIKRYCTRV